MVYFAGRSTNTGSDGGARDQVLWSFHCFRDLGDVSPDLR
jgi:hypothetical protein